MPKSMDEDRIRGNITENMPVASSDGNQIASVDHLDTGNIIKLAQDNGGDHHWIPLDWVTQVDEHVHVNRSREQVMKEWSDTPPTVPTGS